MPYAEINDIEEMPRRNNAAIKPTTTAAKKHPTLTLDELLEQMAHDSPDDSAISHEFH